MKKKIFVILLIVFSFVFLIISSVLFTKSGSKKAIQFISSSYSKYGSLSFKHFEGTLFKGVSLKDVELTQIDRLPLGTVLRIQELFIQIKDFGLNNYFLELQNARLRFSDSDPIVMTGSIKNGEMDVNIFSRGFSVNEIISYLPDLKQLIPIMGDVSEIDLFIKGKINEPQIVGNFTVGSFVYRGFILSNSPWKVDILLKDIKRDVKLFGSVVIHDGSLKTKKSTINQIAGNINFSGEWNQPNFILSGHSKVERTKIKIDLKGTLDKPKLALSSEPPHSRQKLMVMLATGKSWQSVEEYIDSGTLQSREIAKDFIDYYFFAGKSNKFAEQLGIHDVSVKFDKDVKGIEAKKGLTDKFEVGYGVEQSNDEDQKTTIQKIQGELLSKVVD